MLEWFKEEVFLMPNWAWFAVIGGVALILIAVIIISTCRKSDKSKTSPEPVLMPAQKESAADTKEAVKEEEAPAPVEETPAVAEQPVEEVKPVEEKPAAKKPAAKKAATVKAEEPAAKPAAKKAAPKKTAEAPAEEKPAAKKTAPKKTEAVKATPAADKSDEVKVYHISKREDKKWEVRIEGGDKALKLFFTQKEAIDYTRKISGKKRIIVHKEDGGSREV